MYFLFLSQISIYHLFLNVPSPSFPACSAAPPCKIFVRTFSPSAGGCCAAALPMPAALLPIPTAGALEPLVKTKKKHNLCRPMPPYAAEGKDLCGSDLPMPVSGGAVILVD